MADLQVWPFEANSSDELDEDYGYLTDVLIAHNGAEQRVQLRRHPQGAIEFSFLCETLADSQLAHFLLYENQPTRWIVPHWFHARALGASITAGATTLVLDTVGAPFQDPQGLGDYAVIWRDANTYEAVSIDSVNPTSILLSAGTALSWATPRTFVLPARVGRLDQMLELRRETWKLLSGRVRFEFDSVDMAFQPVPGGETLIYGDVVIPAGG